MLGRSTLHCSVRPCSAQSCRSHGELSRKAESKPESHMWMIKRNRGGIKHQLIPCIFSFLCNNHTLSNKHGSSSQPHLQKWHFWIGFVFSFWRCLTYQFTVSFYLSCISEISTSLVLYFLNFQFVLSYSKFSSPHLMHGSTTGTITRIYFWSHILCNYYFLMFLLMQYWNILVYVLCGYISHLFRIYVTILHLLSKNRYLFTTVYYMSFSL